MGHGICGLRQASDAHRKAPADKCPAGIRPLPPDRGTATAGLPSSIGVKGI